MLYYATNPPLHDAHVKKLFIFYIIQRNPYFVAAKLPVFLKSKTYLKPEIKSNKYHIKTNTFSGYIHVCFAF